MVVMNSSAEVMLLWQTQLSEFQVSLLGGISLVMYNCLEKAEKLYNTSIPLQTGIFFKLKRVSFEMLFTHLQRDT